MRPRPLARGDIVLLPFPFTDLSGQKVRPTLIISPDPTGEDLWVAFISSIMPPYQNLPITCWTWPTPRLRPRAWKGRPCSA